MVPTFTAESIDEGGARPDPDSIATPTPQFFDVASPPDRQPGFGVGPHRTSDTGHALHTGPYPSGLNRYWTYGALDSGSDLVAQDEQLDVLGRRCAAEQYQPADKPTEDQVEHA